MSRHRIALVFEVDVPEGFTVAEVADNISAQVAVEPWDVTFLTTETEGRQVSCLLGPLSSDERAGSARG